MHGGIAQLGERLNGIQEVSGSIPLISTIRTAQLCGSFFIQNSLHLLNLLLLFTTIQNVIVLIKKAGESFFE